jgi:proteasome lid subunit RPN8/RPN11
MRRAWKRKPVLRFSPTAWAKLLYFRDRGETEIGGFAITSQDDLLHVEAFVTVKQTADVAGVSFDDEAVADYFDAQVDAGRRPEQFARLWCHTHPGESAQPSSVDEETFERVFGQCDWAVMLVLGKTGKTTARLRFNTGPGGEVLIPVEVDYGSPFAASDLGAWEAEYQANVKAETWMGALREQDVLFADDEPECSFDASDWLAAYDALDPRERRRVLDELTSRPDLWDEESEVMWI